MLFEVSTLKYMYHQDNLWHPMQRSEIHGFLFIPGIEARGFIFGPPIALAIGAKFVPLRKPRKLPGNFYPITTLLGLVV